MKRLVYLLCVAFALPLFGQVSTVSPGSDANGPATGSVSTAANITSVMYWYWPGMISTTGSNYSEFSGNFTSGVTMQTGLQDQALYNQNVSGSKYYVADTTWTSQSYPVWGQNPNCVYSYYVTSCPVGQSPWIITDPIPQSTSLSQTSWSNGCYRTLAETDWTQTVQIGWYNYTSYYHTNETSNWEGNCTVSIQPVPGATY